MLVSLNAAILVESGRRVLGGGGGLSMPAWFYGGRTGGSPPFKAPVIGAAVFELVDCSVRLGSGGGGLSIGNPPRGPAGGRIPPGIKGGGALKSGGAPGCCCMAGRIIWL